MKFYYWTGCSGVKNFGDELNKHIWPRLIPKEIFNLESDMTFVGIGTLLNEHLPQSKNIIVFGAGAGYGKLPEKRNSWDIYFVRGPITAKLLGLEKNKYITDPAILAPELFTPNKKKIKKPGYMPHWRNANGIWKRICDEQNIVYINPLDEVSKIVDDITSVDFLITEAMHGAIVADAFRIPWTPVYDKQNAACLPLKWADWTMSMNLSVELFSIPHINECDAFDSNKSKKIVNALNKIMHKPKALSEQHILDSKLDNIYRQINFFVREFNNKH